MERSAQPNKELFERLKKLRSSIASKKKLPAYVVFPDKTLEEMAAMLPTSLEAIETIYGVGKVKVQQYGDAFLEEIESYVKEKRAAGVALPNYYTVAEKENTGIRDMQIAVTPVTFVPITIENYNEIRERLDEYLSFYRNAAYTPDNLRQAQADRASLNKLKMALSVKNKEIKDICLEPYISVQKQFNELISMIKEPLQSIDAFTAEMEQVRRDEKCMEIKLFYDENAGCLGSLAEDIFSKSWFYDPRWENKSYSERQWRKEILEKIRQADEALQFIAGSAGVHVQAVMAKYAETGSLQEAKRFWQMLERADHFPRTEERERPIVVEAPANHSDRTINGVTQGEAEQATAKEDPRHELLIRVRLSDSQTQMLTSFLASNRFPYEIVSIR